ncbi:polygalacturonase At1g48100-like [Ipomoea triloba]|uniref:polygalacturonase At1g48100-like n=1 Tax=Ipomoea triloba TaxID=35885 RepID=UPI00125E7F1B|nr:polygalacturonase At1g48100-like [Ipomoea triloba]
MIMKGLTLLLILAIAILVWSSNMETCHARQGKHWRQSRGALYKKKPKYHRQHGNAGKIKQKHPSPKPSSPPAPVSPPSIGSGNAGRVFNVVSYGAKGDGNTDDTKAFQMAWAAACKVEASTIIIPPKLVFLVGPISFSGPRCQHNIVFQIDGTIIAPTSSKAWSSAPFQWLEFTKLVGITVKGSGTIDGSGSVWWKDAPFGDPIDDEYKLIVPLNRTMPSIPPIPVSRSVGGRMPSIKPTALRFYGSYNVTVTGIKIQNSPQCHLKFDNCMGVNVYNFSASSPGDSPNTDGIHLQNSRDVVIRSSNLACGDDCVSIQTGCSNVYVHNVNCGPGHGISIGGLGKANTKACVSNITVRDIVMHKTMNGVRIKTWQGGLGFVKGVLFSNIQVSEVQLPIVIDQFYCDKIKCKNQTAAVALSEIHYENIQGTYTVKPVHLACSDSMPCTKVTLNEIKLKPLQEHYHLYDPFCWQTFGELHSPTVPPVDCLKVGKLPSNKVQVDHDQC